MRHIHYFGPALLAVLVVAACGDSKGTSGGTNDGGVRGFGSTGNDAGDSSAGEGDAATDAKVDIDSGAEPDADASDAADAGLACTAIAAPAKAALPHVVTGGARVKDVITAVGALLAAQTPPIAAGTKTYAMQGISCRSISTPSAQGFDCSLDVSIDGRAAVALSTSTPSDLAATLDNALIEAGADDCNDFAHGDFLRLSKVAIDIPSSRIEFDDGSIYALPSGPNVRAGGAAGSAVLHAMENAGVNDCDPSRTVFLVCNKYAETAHCSRTFFPLENVDGSELSNICTPSVAVGPTVQLGDPEALVLWNAILDAAAASGFKPLHGTLAETTIVNAQQFTWDGASVGFGLVADNPRPPPPPLTLNE